MVNNPIAKWSRHPPLYKDTHAAISDRALRPSAAKQQQQQQQQRRRRQQQQ